MTPSSTPRGSLIARLEDAERAAAEADLKAYAHNLARFGGEDCCLAIERAWGLDGYPPEIVSTVLAEVADGGTLDAAIAKAEGRS